MATTFPIPKPYKPLLDPNVRKIVEESGRSTGKTTTNETVALGLTLQSKYNNVLYMRAEQRDLRDIFNSTLSTMQSLGIEQHFECKTSPFEITNKVTGAKIYFRGINGKTIDDLRHVRSLYLMKRKRSSASITCGQQKQQSISFYYRTQK